MIKICCLNDLEKHKFGIEVLTGEACGLNLRILCDFTEKGRKLLIKAYGFEPDFHGGEAWNRGSKDDPHVGSIMLTPDEWRVLGLFGVLENGCQIAYDVRCPNKGDVDYSGVYGFTTDDAGDRVQRWMELWREAGHTFRRFGYHGTAGDRNRHAMTGRVT